MGYTVDWRGVEVTDQVRDALKAALGEFGLIHETEAKRELGPGHGVLTGTLRRSVHGAYPTYAFSRDDVPPSNSSPERGGSGGTAAAFRTKVVIVVGSGMRYARKIEQMYGYIQKGHERARPQLDDLLARAASEAGLT